MVGQILKARLIPTRKALNESSAAVVEFLKNLKLMVDSSEASAKFIKDLKKNEGKKFLKEQEAIDSKAVKVVELGKKASIIETEIDNLNREQKNLKKRKLNFSTLKNMDKKAIAEKIVVLSKDKEKQTEKYNKGRAELAQQLKVFNEVRDLILRTFNAQSSSIDARMKDNVAFFTKKFKEMLPKLGFLKSDPSEQELLLPTAPTGDLNKSQDNTETSISTDTVVESPNPPPNPDLATTLTPESPASLLPPPPPKPQTPARFQPIPPSRTVSHPLTQFTRAITPSPERLFDLDACVFFDQIDALAQ